MEWGNWKNDSEKGKNGCLLQNRSKDIKNEKRNSKLGWEKRSKEAIENYEGRNVKEGDQRTSGKNKIYWEDGNIIVLAMEGSKSVSS